MRTVGSYEAKTNLPRLLDEVASGQTITITRHGVPVAILVPAAPERRMGTAQVIAELLEFRKGRSLDGSSVRDMIDEGRL